MKTRYIGRLVIAGLFSLSLGIAYSQQINTVTPIPANPNAMSSFTLRCQGAFFNSCYRSWLDCSNFCNCYTVQTNHIQITIQYYNMADAIPDAVCLTIIQNWQEDISVCGLPAGGYRATVRFVPMDSGPVTTAHVAFVVGQTSLSQVRVSESNMLISWPSLQSLKYSIQSSPSLSPHSSWTTSTLLSNVVGNGSTMHFETPLSDEAVKKYRLVIAPQ